MPRPKGYNRSLAAQRRRALQLADQRADRPANPPSPPRWATSFSRGTGSRHSPREWPVSVSGKQHRLVLPEEPPTKEFVLLVGNSHLRAVVDGLVPMPEGRFSFGISATPGGSARHIHTELAASVVPHEVSLVCVMAPCNGLTACRTVDEAAREFARLLAHVGGRWPKVCVVDFPPRLSADQESQTLLRQAYHRVATGMGFRYFPVAEKFDLGKREQWARDGTHLSDSHGMPILVQLLWQACYKQVELDAAALAASVAPPPGPRPSTSRVPRRVVPAVPRSEPSPEPLPMPSPPPTEWTIVGRACSARSSPVSPKRPRLAQEVGTVFSIPLSPCLFSPAMLVEMERFSPSHGGSGKGVGSFPSGKKTSQARRRRRAARKTRRPQRQAEAAQEVVAVRPGSPASVVPAVAEDQAAVGVVEVTPGTSPTSVVIVDSGLDIVLEDERQVGDVEVTPGTSLTSSRDGPVVSMDQKTSTSSVASPPSPHRIIPPAAHEESAPHTRDRDKSCICCAQSDVEVSDSGSLVSFGSGIELVVDSPVVATVEMEDVVGVPSTIRGSFHQDDDRFRYPGVQCAAMALVAIGRHNVFNVFSWKREDLDRTLVLGDVLYAELRDNNLTGGFDYLLVTDLPKEAVIDGRPFRFEFSQPVNGAANVVEHEFIVSGSLVTLDAGLEQMLARYNTCLLTLCGNTCAVIKDKGRYAVVDSHSRNAIGKVDVDGTSVVLYFSCINDLYAHFCGLAECFEVEFKEFEITGVVVGLQSKASEVVPPRILYTPVQKGKRRRSGKVNAESSVPKHTHPPKMTKFDRESDADLDVQFTSVTENTLHFSPLSERVSRSLCKNVKIDYKRLAVAEPETTGPVRPLGVPCTNEKIVADGNCFFRSISQAVSGTQKYHRRIRLAIVKHLETNPLKYQSVLRDGYSSVAQYISDTKMRKVNTWATEVEIQAAADILGVDIYTFLNGRWLKFGCTTTPLSTNGIYLENINNSHYENVTCVKNPETHNCYGCCQISESILVGYNTRSRQVDAQCCNSPKKEFSAKHKTLSKYIQKKKQKHLKTKYDTFKEKMQEALKKKYRDNVNYRQKIKVLNSAALKLKYRINLHYREKKKATVTLKYRDNIDYRDQKKTADKVKYRDNIAYRDQKKAAVKVKYRDNIDYRDQKKAAVKVKYRDNIDYRDQKRAAVKVKYRDNIDYRDQKRASVKVKYRDNIDYRDQKKAAVKVKYRDNVDYREQKKAADKVKYRDNVGYRENKKASLKAAIKQKYRFNIEYRRKKKLLTLHKYHEDVEYKQKQRAASVKKYKDNLEHKQNIKVASKQKYKSSPKHKHKVKTYSKIKYHNNDEYKNQTRTAYKNRKRQIKKQLADNFDLVKEHFWREVENGPEYICCVCFKLLFINQVLPCRKDDFMADPKSAAVAEVCISEAYLHTCSSNCLSPCPLSDCRGSLWICYTCNSKVKNGQMPAECSVNNLQLDDIPPELACLNTVEQHIVALNMVFMQMCALPKGGQGGIHGPVTCIPANIIESTKLLPRRNMDGWLLPVKLKRKLTYKGHYEYQYVDTEKIRRAIAFLKANNGHYLDIEFDEEWVNDFIRREDEAENNAETEEPAKQGQAEEGQAKQEQVEQAVQGQLAHGQGHASKGKAVKGKTLKGKAGKGQVGQEQAGKATQRQDEQEAEDDLDDEHLHDRQRHCMFQDTFFMPIDIAQDALDHYFQGVLNLAPAEGNSPVSLLKDKENEAKCFPKEFPFGRNTYHTPRPVRITLCRYFINRLLHADGRFARNLKFLFLALYMLEVEQVVSKVSIALRKGHACQGPGNAAADEETLENLLQFDNGYRFMKPIRGTPPYWQSALKDLIAMVRQLGIPTWFCSFSSADLRWESLLRALLKIEGSTRRVEDLDWAQRCDLLRRNPVTAARMFDTRWRHFLNKVLKSPAKPIGEIVDYFYRVEFQQRGSPHVHCLFWIKDAPKIGENTDEEVIEFVDKYVSCELPTDPVLLEKVTSVQQHSKRHSKTCKKGKKKCRFNFPRPPSMRTFIKKIDPEEEPIMRKEEAIEIMTALKNVLLDENVPIDSVESLFAALGLNQVTFELVYQALGGHTHVVLKRGVKEVWINNYNAKLLDAWDANMDIQFVVDAWACIVYIISYISKAEREMGLLLGNAQKEASKGNDSAKEALKKLGRVYLHNRDVSAQEAVYRVTNMHLKEFSRKVEFIPTGDNIVRLSKPIGQLDGDTLADDDIWMTNIVDRYKSRPNDDTFNDMCIATFVSEYRVLSQTEKCKNAILLQNSLGAIAKRVQTKPAIVRYARFSETKNPELFNLSILQLFLPYRDEADLKPAPYETYEEFYEIGEVYFSDGSVHSVKSIVDSNRRLFEVEAEDLEEIQENMDCQELLEEAWADLCPEQEAERLESREEFREMLQDLLSEQEPEHIPDLAVRSEDISHFERTNVMSRVEGLALVRSLNEQQLSIFYQVRQWCLEKVAGNDPKPLHVFITGGAGTGKSHLIRAIQYEASRLLAPICHSPDNISILITAPTGIAAYNLQAATIHSTFSIPANVQKQYKKLGEDKLNTLRTKYIDVQILIIDEISMVDQKVFTYIDGRLGQIKQTGDSILFGNICVITVGDFYQLPPVKGDVLYKETSGINLFTDYFKIAELKTVVRQQDNTFAELLNRLRVRSKGTPMLQSDIDILRRCETGEEPDVLHVFTKRDFVKTYNLIKLNSVCSDIRSISARDFGIDKNSGKLKELRGNLCLRKSEKPSLVETLHIGVNARVMLCKNVDLADGLVNGVCGVVTYIVDDPRDDTGLPLAVYVKFDDDRVGANRRKQTRTPADLTGSTRIGPEEDQVNKQGERRRQFPLKLAWACTVHKVQGITVDQAVVSLKEVFAPGQAYVALSRVRSLEGLVIQDFEEKAIYCNSNVRPALENMPPFVVDSLSRHRQETHVLTVFFMNIQGLVRHVSDLASQTQPLQPNCMAVVETWLTVDSSFDSCQIEGFTFHSRPRSISYEGSNNRALVSLRGQQYGGVGMYCEESLNYDITVQEFDLECLVNHFAELQIIIAVVYRPSSYPMSLFKYNLDRLLNWLQSHCATVALMGDFNDDVLKSSSLCNFMLERGYSQYVTAPTTERGTLIDHFYLKSSDYDVDCSVVPTYFSDHEGIVCSFKEKCTEMSTVD